jgi:hypothetical protein
MWCKECQFRIEDKTASPNPFYVEEEDQGDAEQKKTRPPGLGEQLATWHENKKK